MSPNHISGSFEELRCKIRKALAEGPYRSLNFSIEAMFPDYVLVTVTRYGDGLSYSYDDRTKLERVDYSTDKDGKIKLSGAPSEVKLTTAEVSESIGEANAAVSLNAVNKGLCEQEAYFRTIMVQHRPLMKELMGVSFLEESKKTNIRISTKALRAALTRN